MTPLDTAHAAMEADPGDDTRRVAFYGLFADTELFVMLAGDSAGDDVQPALFDVEGARYLVAFDREDRLTGFTGEITPYAALPGRGLAAMIAGEGIGIALNAELPSAMLIPPDAVDWLAATLAEGAHRLAARPRSFHSPQALPDALMQALGRGLAQSAGLVSAAWIAGVTYEDDSTGHLIGFAGVPPGAEAALAGMVREALVFSGIDEGWLDVAVFAAGDPNIGAIDGVGRALPVPAPPPEAPPRPAPGTDPDRPPRLR
ncbi:MAG: SseB family protein [Rubellimicrobium sp.]|nr:SseB family protein [Rubellimicrobium sp.]